MPTPAQVDRAMEEIDSIRPRYAGQLVIDLVVPDDYARRPQGMHGRVGATFAERHALRAGLPCHAAATIPGLQFWSVRDHALDGYLDHSPAFKAYRGTDWMQEPCRSCEFAKIDFGGCRCQALAIAGDAAATDPACELSPIHSLMRKLAESDASAADDEYRPGSLGR